MTDALCPGVSSGVKEGIQWDALEAGNQPIGEGEHHIESHGHIHPAAECGFRREAKVEQ